MTIGWLFENLWTDHVSSCVIICHYMSSCVREGVSERENVRRKEESMRERTSVRGSEWAREKIRGGESKCEKERERVIEREWAIEREWEWVGERERGEVERQKACVWEREQQRESKREKEKGQLHHLAPPYQTLQDPTTLWNTLQHTRTSVILKWNKILPPSPSRVLCMGGGQVSAWHGFDASLLTRAEWKAVKGRANISHIYNVCCPLRVCVCVCVCVCV